MLEQGAVQGEGAGGGPCGGRRRAARRRRRATGAPGPSSRTGGAPAPHAAASRCASSWGGTCSRPTVPAGPRALSAAEAAAVLPPANCMLFVGRQCCELPSGQTTSAAKGQSLTNRIRSHLLQGFGVGAHLGGVDLGKLPQSERPPVSGTSESHVALRPYPLPAW